MDLRIRKANINDLNLYFEWTNDSEVRNKSFHSDKITFENHSIWFNKKINDESTQMYVFEYNKNPCGQVRIGIENSTSIIGISIDSKYRGKGLGKTMLEMASREFFKKYNFPIFAYIKTDNIASVKIFEKAGFNFVCNDSINNKECFKYKLLNENR